MSMIFVLCALCFVLVFRALTRYRRVVSQQSRNFVKRTKDKAPRTKYRSLSKLFKKPNIILEQQSNIIELIDSGAGAIDAEAEGKAGKFFGIYICGPQDIRMHHAGATQF